MKFTISFLLVLLLGACSSRPNLPAESVESQLHQQQLSQLTHWQIDGRMAYIDGKEKHSANFSWQQQPGTFNLDLRTFIGTSILHLQQQKQNATLEMDNEYYTAPNATELLDKLTGWHIPVKQLSTWIKGQSTGKEQVTLATAGWVEQLIYQGWRVDYSHYQAVSHLALPHEVRLQKQQRKIILRINQWQLN
ncbi:lipoprotein insertase outer membrane protein LolB [Neptunicella sp. SCSIO 80796]|uniref:lipoprotein insertase outer membrane protein LolB n=1 Tax=Neptunicella plasticusilytica TaxID=3117012 RepID=UPI003A4D84BC